MRQRHRITNSLVNSLTNVKQNLQDVQSTLEEIGKEVILPAYGRNFDAAGVKKKVRGHLRNALTKRGEPGNIFTISGNTLTTGVDYQPHKYFKYFIEGRGPVKVKRAKFLRFVNEDGKVIFTKRVRSAPAHPNIVKIDNSDMIKAQDIINLRLDPNYRLRKL